MKCSFLYKISKCFIHCSSVKSNTKTNAYDIHVFISLRITKNSCNNSEDFNIYERTIKAGGLVNTKKKDFIRIIAKCLIKEKEWSEKLDLRANFF